MADHLNTAIVSEIAEAMDIDNANPAETTPALDNELESMAGVQEPSAPAEINMDDASGSGSEPSINTQVSSRVSSQPVPPGPGTTLDPLGYYGEALDNNLRGPLARGKRDGYGGRSYDDNLREQSNEIGFGCGRQVTRFDGHEHQQARGSSSHGSQGGEDYNEGASRNPPARSRGPVRGRSGSRSARNRGRAQPSRASNHGEGEVTDDEPSPQANMTTAPPNSNGDDVAESPLSTPANRRRSISNMRPQPADESDDDDDDLFVAQEKPTASRGRRGGRGALGGNRGRGSTRGRARHVVAAAPSLRIGKAPFSVRNWGLLENEDEDEDEDEDEEPVRPTKRNSTQAENDRPVQTFSQTSSRQRMLEDEEEDEEPVRPTKRRSTQGENGRPSQTFSQTSSRQRMLEDEEEDEEPVRPTKRRSTQGDNGRPSQTSSQTSSRQRMPEGWQNHQSPNHQGLSMTSSSHPPSFSGPRSHRYEEDEDDMDEYDEDEYEDDDEGMGMSMGNEYGQSRRSRSTRRPAFNQSATERYPSRYSGIVNPYNINQDPPMVAQNEVSDAYLKKRGLERGKKDKVCKRGYGANDPENIQIVNLHETEGKTMDEIAKILNAARIKAGKKPGLTKLSVSARYSRTAPLLFAAQGETFVPLSERRKPGWQKSAPTIVWNDDLDELLVECVKTWEQRRWTDVADLFNDATGYKVNRDIVSVRYSLL